MKSSPVSPQAAAQELLLRRQARANLLDFTALTMPTYEVNWHHRLVCEYLDKFVDGTIRRLMVFMPPRHGKSELVSRRLPAYILGRNPDATIIAASYGAELARRMSRDVQRIMDLDAYRRIFPDTRLAGAGVKERGFAHTSDFFEVVGHGGYYRGAGVGGAMTGMGMLYGIIDDPVKNRKEANSPTYRDGVWEWYTSTFRTRLAPDGVILLTVTRWHEDDLAGRLLALAASDPQADQWTVLTLPAVAEEPAAVYDPRRPGEALWPSHFDEDRLAQTMVSLGGYDWNSLYQQRPRPREGGMFKRSWFDVVGAAPADAKRVRYWDKAGSTAGSSDYTAGVKMARDADGVFYVEDVIRGQYTALERERIIRQAAEMDGCDIWIEQEPGSGGKESAEATVRNLAGFVVRTETVTGDKETRAAPFAAQCEARNVHLVRGAWNASYLEELTSFPNGAHDDQVDGSSGAFNKLALQISSLVDFA